MTKTHLNVVKVIYRGIPNHLVAYTFKSPALKQFIHEKYFITQRAHCCTVLFAVYNYEEIVH